MVSRIGKVIGVVSTVLLCSTLRADEERQMPSDVLSEITGVRVVGQSADITKPCKPVTVVFEVSVCESASRAKWREIVRLVSNLVRINGRDFRNPLVDAGPANYACSFDLLWPEPVDRKPRMASSETALLAASCQFDLKTHDCLFRDAGQYLVQFFFGGHSLTVILTARGPTRPERRIVEKLSTLPMVLFLLQPTDMQHATPENIEELEALLEVSPDYSTMISWTLGVAKGVRVGRPRWRTMTEEEQRDELKERYALLKSVANEKHLTTRLAGLAGSELTNVAVQLAHMEPDLDRRGEYLDIYSRVRAKVAECVLVPHAQAMAKGAIMNPQ